MTLLVAGQRITSGVVSWGQIAGSSSTAGTGTFTAETVTDTVTANLIIGYTYQVEFLCMGASSVANDQIYSYIRQDNISGAGYSHSRTVCVTANVGYPILIKYFYTATVTGAKTFVGTMARGSGTGNITRLGNASWPSLLTVYRV